MDKVTPIEPAATVILVRTASSGLEVLMQQRNHNATFGGGAWVFPGGKLDPSDHLNEWQDQCDLSHDEANVQLATSSNGLAYWIAAIRELVEEAGILIGHKGNAQLAHAAQQFLNQHPNGFLNFCRSNELQLATSNLRYLSRWVTPPLSPKRYDTRFFICQCPGNQQPRQDGVEAIDTCWISPAKALQYRTEGSWHLMRPTLATLEQLNGASDIGTLCATRLTTHKDEK